MRKAPCAVRFLPVVERELRVAARQRRTWWRRVLTMDVALAYEIDQRHFRALPNIGHEIAFASWAGCHLLVCGAYLARATWHLRRNFRALAASSTRRPWWGRSLAVPPDLARGACRFLI